MLQPVSWFRQCPKHLNSASFEAVRGWLGTFKPVQYGYGRKAGNFSTTAIFSIEMGLANFGANALHARQAEKRYP